MQLLALTTGVAHRQHIYMCSVASGKGAKQLLRNPEFPKHQAM